ncbi:hypothetical protein [Leifsonia sp. Leaf264]|uniref:hypothetical protein n=1 Tax=Leifsonia sp. Leaf264 TaxID=1736314 RepID=UPI0006F30A15|nr:hypothetical protein [Leifsonia sp. Leaf264]KQO98121.1 hypothetical protein ASF30_08475 [Leifsonia sp. Leaf264]
MELLGQVRTKLTRRTAPVQETRTVKANIGRRVMVPNPAPSRDEPRRYDLRPEMKVALFL